MLVYYKHSRKKFSQLHTQIKHPYNLLIYLQTAGLGRMQILNIEDSPRLRAVHFLVLRRMFFKYKVGTFKRNSSRTHASLLRVRKEIGILVFSQLLSKLHSPVCDAMEELSTVTKVLYWREFWVEMVVEFSGWVGWMGRHLSFPFIYYIKNTLCWEILKVVNLLEYKKKFIMKLSINSVLIKL